MDGIFSHIMGSEMIGCGGVLAGIGAVIGAVGSLFGGGSKGGGDMASVAQPVAPDVTQSQDQKAAQEKARNLRVANSRNSTTATGGLGVQEEPNTMSKVIG